MLFTTYDYNCTLVKLLWLFTVLLSQSSETSANFKMLCPAVYLTTYKTALLPHCLHSLFEDITYQQNYLKIHMILYIVNVCVKTLSWLMLLFHYFFIDSWLSTHESHPRFHINKSAYINANIKWPVQSLFPFLHPVSLWIAWISSSRKCSEALEPIISKEMIWFYISCS